MITNFTRPHAITYTYKIEGKIDGESEHVLTHFLY